MKILLISLLLLGVFPCFGQSNPSYQINLIQIKDSALISGIKIFVDKTKQELGSDSSIKAFGYIGVSVQSCFKGDTIRKYVITRQRIAYKKDFPDNIYPDLYTYLDGNLILIHERSMNEIFVRNLSEKSKKDMRKFINETLDKPQKRTFYNMQGEKLWTDKEFRLDYPSFDSGLTVYVLKNSKFFFK